ncbi:sulfatase [Mangrovibacterium sp.]|uniref:sulfatase n=1 Tax=Mangrovibacterium sp. TaxID=1961364 RepID=UPI003563D978
MVVCRSLLKLFAFGLLVPVSGCGQLAESTRKKNTEKPNVVFIMVDDLGWSDLGYMGSNYYETPNIARLAGNGMVFTNAYAGAANCAPSRAALMSGMSAPRTGVYTVSPSDRGNAKSRKLIPIENTDFINDSVYTLAEMFKDAGYVTGHFGKWHIGEDPGTQGFDVNIGGGRWGHPKSYFAPYVYPEIEAPEGEYLTDRITGEAITFIENNKNNPFFLYLPFYTVHTPIQGKQAIVEKYRQKAGNNNHNRPDYAAMIETMDFNVGRVLDKLDELELSNTLLVFTSDNGGIFAVSKQTPLRAGKGSYYEGGIRVPLIVRWPGMISHRITDVPVVHLDFFPTFKDIIGADIPGNQPMDGTSLKNLLIDGEELDERPIFFHFPVYLQAYSKTSGCNRDPLFRTRPGTSVRYGDWKLLHFYEDDDYELYNLKTDSGEKENLVNEHPGKADELKILMDNWCEETNAPIPNQLNPDFDSHWNQEQISKYRTELNDLP